MIAADGCYTSNRNELWITICQCLDAVWSKYMQFVFELVEKGSSLQYSPAKKQIEPPHKEPPQSMPSSLHIPVIVS